MLALRRYHLSLSILIVSAEAYPLAKTGALADIVSTHARALFEAGASPTLLMPAYRNVYQQLKKLKCIASLTGLPGGNATLLHGNIPNFPVPIILLECERLYNRNNIYCDSAGNDWPDNIVRFAMLAAAGARIAHQNFNCSEIRRPHIVHCHDWHTGLLPLYLKLNSTQDVKCVFTLHNIAHQGNFPYSQLSTAKDILIPDHFLSSKDDESIRSNNQINFSKSGITFSDAVTTVSENYAEEIKSPRFGESLEKTICQNEYKLSGIANGTDLKIWNPDNDIFLPFTYTAKDLHGKKMCKQILQQFFNLIPDSSAPLIGMCGQRFWQKMGDSLIEAIDSLIKINNQVQVIILGEGNKIIEEKLLQCALRHSGRVSVTMGYDEQRGHLLIAGADMLLHLSRYEPCGLTAIHAMQYGTLPIASRIAGLIDSVYNLADPGVYSDIMFDINSQHSGHTFSQPYQELWSQYSSNRIDDEICVDKNLSIHSFCRYSRLTNLHTFVEKSQPYSPNYTYTHLNQLEYVALPNHIFNNFSTPNKFNTFNTSQKLATGFLFDGETSEAIINATMRAIYVFKNKKLWQCMQISGMQRDWSWSKPIKAYMDIYNKILDKNNVTQLTVEEKNKTVKVNSVSYSQADSRIKSNISHSEPEQLARHY